MPWLAAGVLPGACLSAFPMTVLVPAGAVMRVRSALAFATHLFFRQRGFQYVHTPIISAADCEGAGEVFQARLPPCNSCSAVEAPPSPSLRRPTAKGSTADHARERFLVHSIAHLIAWLDWWVSHPEPILLAHCKRSGRMLLHRGSLESNAEQHPPLHCPQPCLPAL